MTFRTYLTTSKPLYIDGTMKVNFTVDELCQFVEDYLKDNQPILTVEMHEPVSIEPIWMVNVEEQNNMHRVDNSLTFEESVRYTQDNHFHTKG